MTLSVSATLQKEGGNWCLLPGRQRQDKSNYQMASSSPREGAGWTSGKYFHVKLYNVLPKGGGAVTMMDTALCALSA